MIKPRLLLIILLSAAAGAAQAYQPLATDDTGTQGLGGHQLEASHETARSRLASVSSFDRALPLAYTYGVSDALDLSLGLTRQTTPGEAWNNPTLGAKWRFWEGEGQSLAVKPEITLPVSDAREAAGYGTARTSYALTFIYSRDVDFGEWHVNLSAEQVNYADTAAFPDRRNRWRLSTAPVWHVSETLKLALDLGIQTNPDPAERARMGFAELGLIYSPSSDLDLSLGWTRDLMDGPVSNATLSVGLTWRFH